MHTFNLNRDMKSIGKIGVLLISFFLVSSIFFFINIETYGIEGATRFRGLQILFIIGIPWFITYSKWANNNIWNKKTSKPVETIKPKPKKTSKADNSNSEYIKIDKKLFNTILIVLGVIVVFYIGYISAGNLNVSTQQAHTCSMNFNELSQIREIVDSITLLKSKK